MMARLGAGILEPPTHSQPLLPAAGLGHRGPGLRGLAGGVGQWAAAGGRALPPPSLWGDSVRGQQQPVLWQPGSTAAPWPVVIMCGVVAQVG
jgi:hypothetical protein